MSFWKRIRDRFVGPRPEEFAVEGDRVVFRSEERARALKPPSAGWGPSKMDACGSCSGRVREVVFTTAGHGEEQRALFRAVPLAVDGWICTSCGWSVAPRRVSPEEVTSFLESGARHGETGQLDDAEYWFLRACSSWPDYPPALGNLAEVKRVRAQAAPSEERAALMDEAEALLRRAVENEAGIPAPPHFRLELARMEALRGSESSALRRLDALAKDEEAPEPMREEARELGKQVRSGRALFTRASELASPLIVLEGRPAGPLREDERAALAEAMTLLEKAAQRDETAFATHWLTGKIHQRLGENASAVDAFARAYERKPDQADVCRDYVLSLLQVDRAEHAVPVARRACEVRAEDAGLRSNLALTLLLAGEVDESLQVIREALRLDGTDPITLRLCRVIERVREGEPRPRTLAELERRAR